MLLLFWIILNHHSKKHGAGGGVLWVASTTLGSSLIINFVSVVCCRFHFDQTRPHTAGGSTRQLPNGAYNLVNQNYDSLWGGHNRASLGYGHTSLNAFTFGCLFQKIGITGPLVKKSCVRPAKCKLGMFSRFPTKLPQYQLGMFLAGPLGRRIKN
jgi:hypothetical protein